MKKKTYAKPELMREEFVPNEYVAACAEEPGYTQYSFICNAGKGVTHEGFLSSTKYVWNVYVNGQEITNKGGKGSYGACGDTHIVKVPAGTPVELVFSLGYMDNKYTDVNENIPVYVWRGEDGKNVHCMTNPGTTHIAVPKQLS